mmetsp:Transcript_3448/g.5011  ORF Transcript_3448/g.5011 Transcript_3448/m.5011 type:complete len:166 (+) Transcript_3448:580-1077(+)
MGLPIKRSRDPKMLTTLSQTLTKTEEEERKYKNLNQSDKRYTNIKKSVENEENSGTFRNLEESSEILQKIDISDNFLGKIGRTSWFDTLINEEGKRLLELEILIEEKIVEHYRKKKLILVGVAPGKFKLKMARRNKCTLEEWKALNCYIGTTIKKYTTKNENWEM